MTVEFKGLSLDVIGALLPILDCVMGREIDPQVPFSTIRYLQKYYFFSKNPSKDYLLMAMAALNLSAKVNESNIPIAKIEKCLKKASNNEKLVENLKKISDKNIDEILNDNFRKHIDECEFDLITTLNFDFSIINPLNAALRFFERTVSWYIDTTINIVPLFLDKDTPNEMRPLFDELLHFPEIYNMKDRVISLALAKLTLERFEIPISEENRSWNSIFNPAIEDSDFQKMFGMLKDYIEEKWADREPPFNSLLDLESLDEYICYPVETLALDQEPICPPPEIDFLKSLIPKDNELIYKNSYADHIPSCPPPSQSELPVLSKEPLNEYIKRTSQRDDDRYRRQHDRRRSPDRPYDRRRSPDRSYDRRRSPDRSYDRRRSPDRPSNDRSYDGYRTPERRYPPDRVRTPDRPNDRSRSPERSPNRRMPPPSDDRRRGYDDRRLPPPPPERHYDEDRRPRDDRRRTPDRPNDRRRPSPDRFYDRRPPSRDDNRDRYGRSPPRDDDYHRRH